MKKNIIAFGMAFIMLMACMPVFNIVSAEEPGHDDSDDFWKSAGTWFGAVQDEIGGEGQEGNVSATSIEIVNKFMDIVNYVGTTFIIIATMFLGVKYMFGSVEGKSEVKESLVTLLVACVFFFGWQYIRDIILIGNGTQLFISDPTDSYENIFARLLGVVTMIIKVAAIAGVIYVGVRYIFAGAGGKAELKDKSGYFIIGIILTFCSVTVLTVFSKALQDLLG